MTATPQTPGLAAGRLPAAEIADNFSDIAPCFDGHEALVAADRCYFCHDAPCTEACPTSIDVPLFIRQIQSGQPEAAARTIFEANILGGMCARVCPTETLCEEACVREAAEGRPVEIGRLQRYATDTLMARQGHPFTRGPETGKRVAVVGAGPAGLACAHRLAMLGHEVVVFEARPKPGGLNEYGIAAYKAVDGFAEKEIAWLAGIGGITFRHGARLGQELALADLRAEFDAVFLGLGLGAARALEVEGAVRGGVQPAIDFIREIRQAADLTRVPVARRVAVIGGGMTAIDAAVQARKLGAEEVTLVYRRSRARMAASAYEQDLAARAGVRIVTNAVPVAVAGNGPVGVVEFAYTDGDSGTRGTETFRLAVEQVLVAIGQAPDALPGELALDGGRIAVNGPGRTSLAGVWAGGDCVAGGADLTVTAVAGGRDAAMDIDAALRA